MCCRKPDNLSVTSCQICGGQDEYCESNEDCVSDLTCVANACARLSVGGAFVCAVRGGAFVLAASNGGALPPTNVNGGALPPTNVNGGALPPLLPDD